MIHRAFRSRRRLASDSIAFLDGREVAFSHSSTRVRRWLCFDGDDERVVLLAKVGLDFVLVVSSSERLLSQEEARLVCVDSGRSVSLIYLA